MEYVVYLIASIMAIIVMHRVKKAWLAKGYKRGICSIAAGVLGLCGFFVVIIAAVSQGIIKPPIADSTASKQTSLPSYSSDIPQ